VKHRSWESTVNMPSWRWKRPSYTRPQIVTSGAIATTMTKVKMAPLNSSTITIPLYLLVAIVATL